METIFYFIVFCFAMFLLAFVFFKAGLIWGQVKNNNKLYSELQKMTKQYLASEQRCKWLEESNLTKYDEGYSDGWDHMQPKVYIAANGKLINGK